MSFVNLHQHSHYSLLDGFGSPKDIVLRAKELGYPAAALTDHGVTYGLIEFYQEAKAAGIKPILGCEMYVSPRTRFDKEAKTDVKPYHLTILAKDNAGYENLLTLVTKGHLEGFYYKPRIDYGLLKVYGKGLIALSGCITGHLPRLILSNDQDGIDALINQYLEIFGKEDFYLEVQDHPLNDNQETVNKELLKLSKKYGLKMVLTNDSHYPRITDKDAHDILLCMQLQTTIHDENRMKYTGDFSIRDYRDMSEYLKEFPGIVENTLEIADKCNVEFEFGTNLIPSYKTPNNEDTFEYMKVLCEEGLQKRFKDKPVPENYKERLTFELDLIHKMGFDTYFLIVSDFVRYAKDQKIVVGPGRGSAAGSIMAWSLNITDLDPIHYGLFFERFMNPERVSMPDIDIDFADTRRDEVLAYVIDKYGRDNVAQIITFGTMAPRAAVRDVGRALGYPYAEVDKLAKTVPPPVQGRHVPLKVSIKEDPDLKIAYEKDERAKFLLDYAMKLEGTVRHIGTHACAVVISEKPLTNYTALQHGASDENEIVTQYSAKPLESLGLLKMDFLGLRNLTIIEKTTKIVKRTRDLDINIDNLDLTDEKTFDLFQKADTTGVFQLESLGMKRYLKDLKPTKFEDIVAMGALYRPGPMEWIPTYIKGKKNPEKVHYMHESFKSILEGTYGVAVYQEQILQLARDFSGFTLGEADILRKAVGKKNPILLMEQRKKFIDGAVNKGHKEKFAQEVFENVIEPFAGYGFNKAHAVCYGMIAYQTAYLKAHFPIEFMTALLCSDAMNTERVVLEIKECMEMGISVLPPSINESFSQFTVVDDHTIRFGLLAIKGVGEGPIREILEVRERDGKFKSLEDFIGRVPQKTVNKKMIQALALSGALDEFGDRNQIAENHEEISTFAKYAKNAVSNQADIFGMLEASDAESCTLKMAQVPKATSVQILKWEKELLGLYVSGHPLRGLKKYIGKKAHLIGSLTKKMVGKSVKVLGMVSNLRKVITKTNNYMATFVIEDPSGKVNSIMFPRVFAQYGQSLTEDSVIIITGKLDDRRGQYQVACDSVRAVSLSAMLENAKKEGFYDPEDKSDIMIRFLDDILADKKDSEEKHSGEEEGFVEDFDIGDQTDNDIFTIKIPEGTSQDTMKELSNILQKNKGDTLVEIYLSSSKKIKLPFGVHVSSDLKIQVASILKH